MSKNITIAEGGQAKIFNNVSHLKTNLIGSGTQYWVPEDEAGKYANVGEITINENGTYSARDEDLDGFSTVRVNVSGGGGGGGDEPVLVTKNITSNGTYNASSDGADGYSSVTVNVAFPHNKVVIGDVSNIPVTNRISASDFLHDLNNAVFNVVAPHVRGYLASVQHQLLDEAWLSSISDIYNRNNTIMFGAGGHNPGDNGAGVVIWVWFIGIADESAEVSISNPTENGCSLTLSSGNKFYNAGGIWGIYMHHTKYVLNNVDSYQGMVEEIDAHHLLSNSSEPYIINVSKNNMMPSVGGYNTGLMTNLRW